MENKINIAELLKDCPEGMELDCAMYDNVQFDIVQDGNAFPIKINTPEGRISLSKYGCYSLNPQCKCVIFPKGKTTWDGFHRPFKDGDVVFSGFDLISIYKDQIGGKFGRLHSHVSLRNSCVLEVDKDIWTLENIRFAAEEEKAKLFKAIKDNGYKWNAETKTLERLVEPKFKVGDKVRIKGTSAIYVVTELREDRYMLDDKDISLRFKTQDQWELVPNKFDITTLKPFDKVLVRNNDKGR